MMAYYLLIPILYFFAYLPSSVLYVLADGVAFVLYRVVGYRKKVVFDNLQKSFPDKSNEEILSIAKQSYKHLAYRVVENIKCMTISAQEIDERMVAKNIEAINKYYEEGRHVVLLVGHIAAWEYGGYKMSIACKHKLYGIVSLVTNPHFNKMVQRTRGKMGMQLIPMRDAKDFFAQQLPQPSLIVFIGDQSPSNPKNAYWTKLFNRDTGFFTGGERYARQHNCVVFYPKIVQTGRGYYTAELIEITNVPNSLSENEITERYVRIMEQQLTEYPADWLWSHKRWKHSRLNIDN